MRLRSALEPLRVRFPRRLRYEPWSVLVPLVVLQWLVAAHVARYATHNGWLYFHDHADTWSFTAAWALAHGHVADASVSYGLPLLYAPVAWITGPSLLDALHVLVPVQVGLLVPLGALGAFALGGRAGGRVIGYASAVVWALAPLASISYFAQHSFWVDRILPAIAGLTATAYLPGTLAVLLAGVFALRALDERQLVDAACAGVAAGTAIAIKPTNVLFLAAPVVAFAITRRWRELGAFAAALLPCLVTYIVWREHSVGHIGSWTDALLLPNPIEITRNHFDINIGYYLQQVSWSARVLEWVAVAGFVGLLKRSPVKALFFGTWLGMYVLAEGASSRTQADGLIFWHLLMPAFPAYCVLLASVPLLWPRAEKHLTDPYPYRPRRIVPLTVVAALAVVAAIVPLVAVAASPSLKGLDTVVELQSREIVPVDRSLHVTVRVKLGRTMLSWKAPDLPATPTYEIYRAHGAHDLACRHGSGATRCVLASRRIATTKRTAFEEVPAGTKVTYRVAVIANELGAPATGVAVAISPPARARPGAALID
jgi:hypothetical protein